MRFIILISLSMFMSACGFIDLRPIKYDITPASQNTVLAALNTPVSIAFETEMRKSDTEKIISISSYYGQTDGDIVWHGTKLIFNPAGGWKPGVRYVLKFQGTIYAKDGREDRANSTVHFYAATNSPAPYIKSFLPADGASCGVTKEGGARLRILFSCDMNRVSVEEALNVDGINIDDRRVEWLSESELEITSVKKLSPWTTYRWTLGKGAVSTEGIALTKDESASFITNSDMIFPGIRRVFPAINSGGLWTDNGLPIESGLGFEHGICVDFSKDMDSASALQCFNIDPALQGHTEQLTPFRFIFIPDKAPEISKKYLITIRGDTKDSFGLTTGSDYKVEFVPDIPFLKIDYIYASGSASGNGNDDDYIEENAVKDGALIQPRISGADRNCIIEIEFSLDITQEQKANIPNQISFAPHFPSSLYAASVQSINWKTSKLLEIEYVNIIPGQGTEPHYYKLTMGGGISGLQNGNGSYLESTLNIYIEARP